MKVESVAKSQKKRGLSKEASNQLWNRSGKKASKAFDSFLQEETKKLNKRSS